MFSNISLCGWNERRASRREKCSRFECCWVTVSKRNIECNVLIVIEMYKWIFPLSILLPSSWMCYVFFFYFYFAVGFFYFDFFCNTLNMISKSRSKHNDQVQFVLWSLRWLLLFTHFLIFCATSWLRVKDKSRRKIQCDFQCPGAHKRFLSTFIGRARTHTQTYGPVHYVFSCTITPHLV